MMAGMDTAGPEAEQLERDFPGWVAWSTVRRLWYARWLKSPDVTLQSESSEGLRVEIQAWLERRKGADDDR